MNKILLHEKNKISPEEYLTLERESEVRNEYFDGEIFAMAGASREHNQIASNIVRVLGNQLLEKPCSVFSSDMKVKMEEIGKYCYPDIVLVCGKEEFEDDEKDVLLNPIVIIEILSDSTEAYDRGEKFAHYQLLNSFAEYILISQYFCRVEKFTRQDDETWIYSKYQTVDHVVKIETTHCELPVSEIYRKINFDKFILKRHRMGIKSSDIKKTT
ncbi:MAG: Uma2 family endonuclease [Thermodesulfobacteriota bacterium]|nr:Uma2 family endonuclease [Thermodesulfobacteriota bacterium]